MWAGCTEYFCTKSEVCYCHRKQHGRAWEKTNMGPSESSFTWMVGPRKWSISSANGEHTPAVDCYGTQIWKVHAAPSTKPGAGQESWSATVNMIVPTLVLGYGGSKVLFKGMVCVYLQEKHKARSEKHKKQTNMGTALETHFNVLFFNQIIKIWLAIFGTEVILKFCRF